MNKLVPRLLPLVGVAVAGVLVLKLAGGLDGVSSLFGARASAEEAASAKGAKPKGRISNVTPPGAADTPVQQPGVLPGLAAQAGPNATPAGPAVCAPTAEELARQAGLSPAELQVIQNLGSRRGQLDAREQALDTQLQLIAAAEQKLNNRIQAMNGLKGEIQTLVGQADEKQQGEIDRLVTVYEKMSPKDAGPLMAVLDDKVRLPVAAKMKPAKLADILKYMGTAQAKVLSENLAKRFNPTQSLQAILEGKGQPLAEAKPAAPPPAAPAAAAAPPSPQTAAAEPEKAKAAPAKPKPKQQAKAAPKAAPAKPAKPTTLAKADPPAAAPAKSIAKAQVDAGAVAASGATTKPATPPASKPIAGPPA